MSEKNEYETVRDRVSTRENSTLAIAIAASSASLVLLVIPNLLEFHIFGLIFPLLGILYRELTIFYSDRRDYNRLHGLEVRLGIEREKMSQEGRIIRGLRSFSIRGFLALPIIIFVQIKWALIGLWLGVIVVTLSLTVIVFLEDSIMFDC